jgi:hypothetical protein
LANSWATTKATNLSTDIAGVDNQLQDLACWSVRAKPALAVVDQLQIIGVGVYVL